jgi:ssDNA-binding protein
MASRSKDVKTPLARLSFTSDLFEARAKKSGGKQYGCTLLFPKSADLTALHDIVLEAATAEWGDKAKQFAKDGLIKTPFLDGDGKQALNKKTGERHEGYAGHWFIRCTSGEKYKPKVVDKNRNLIVDAADCPSGFYGYAVVNAYTWENDENGKGITFGLSMLQVAKEGERLAGNGGGNPEEHFDVIADEGNAPAETKTGKRAGGLFG